MMMVAQDMREGGNRLQRHQLSSLAKRSSPELKANMRLPRPTQHSRKELGLENPQIQMGMSLVLQPV